MQLFEFLEYSNRLAKPLRRIPHVINHRHDGIKVQISILGECKSRKKLFHRWGGSPMLSAASLARDAVSRENSPSTDCPTTFSLLGRQPNRFNFSLYVSWDSINEFKTTARWSQFPRLKFQPRRQSSSELTALSLCAALARVFPRRNCFQTLHP